MRVKTYEFWEICEPEHGLSELCPEDNCPTDLGDKVGGWNTITNQYEEWVVIEFNKKNPWKSLMKRA